MLILDQEVNNPFLLGMAQFRSHLSHILTFQMTGWNCLLFRFPVMNIDSGKTSGWFVQRQGTCKESRGGQERRILSTFPAFSWKRSVDLWRNILEVLDIRDWLWTISAPCQNSFYCFLSFPNLPFSWRVPMRSQLWFIWIPKPTLWKCWQWWIVQQLLYSKYSLQNRCMIVILPC